MIEYEGWLLVTEEHEDGDGFIRYEHIAVRGTDRQHLHGSSWLSSFDPDEEQFIYLVSHDFPRPPKGNWYSHELKELIEQEKGIAHTDEPAETILETEDLGIEVLRNGEHNPPPGES